MTKDDYVRALKDITHDGAGRAHFDADKLLLAALRDAGWGEVADAWEAIEERLGFWYE